MTFEPIAIIGHACVLPGAFSSEELWRHVIEKRDCLSFVPENHWRLNPQRLLKDPSNPVWTTRGGYILGFDQIFDPSGFLLSPQDILAFDPFFHWLLHCARKALNQAGYQEINKLKNAGAILGNLSYPSSSLSALTESLWLRKQEDKILAKACGAFPDLRNRFMSGLPIHLLAKALGLRNTSYAIDAACASSLYSIKLACDCLHREDADFMLAGAVNGADDLFLHMGFTALQALSRSGHCKPLDEASDGLIPSQGAALLVLKKLDKAILDKNTIFGVIRGIGLSNDGNERGLLAPSIAGQVAAIEQAYKISGLKPNDVSLIECHATGTPTGDEAEIHSISKVFGKHPLALTALKSNIGHTITVSGAAGIIKLLMAMKENTLPPLAHLETPIKVIENFPYSIVKNPEPWISTEKPKIAAINSFGFGGNNAHLILEEWRPKTHYSVIQPKKVSQVAIVGIGVVSSGTTSWQEFANLVLLNKNRKALEKLDEVDFDITNLRFSPKDLQKTLGQQLMALKAALLALEDLKDKTFDRAAVLIGMQCDPDIARFGLRWRLPDLLKLQGVTPDDNWLEKALAAIVPPLESAHVLGAMPNVSANRLNVQFNCKEPSYTLSSEELSGIIALQNAKYALETNEVDLVIAGAVDKCCDFIHQTAAKEVLEKQKHVPGDAAVIFALKRLDDAKASGDRIFAILGDPQEDEKLQLDETSFTELFGHSHCTSGILSTAVAALACYYKILPAGALPWIASSKPRSACVTVSALGDQVNKIHLKENVAYPDISIGFQSAPRLYCFSGNTYQELLNSLREPPRYGKGSFQLVILARTYEEFVERKKTAHKLLEKAPNSLSLREQGIYYRSQPLQGSLASVFTPAGTGYLGAGKEMVLAFPELVDHMAKQIPNLQSIINRLYDNSTPVTLFDELKNCYFLSQFHHLITQHVLKLKPEAMIGYSSGESNALYAAKAWRDPDKMLEEIEHYGIYTKVLAKEFEVLKNWREKPSQKPWASWRVHAPSNQVQDAILPNFRCYITMINSPLDCLLAGDPNDCQQVIKALGSVSAQELEYNMVVHCALLNPAADSWRRIHYRKTYPVPDVRFYSCATGHAYDLTAESAADALLDQANRQVNFMRVIQNAWNDGVRIFVEHGPRALCTKWIEETLGDREYLAVSWDLTNVSPLEQFAHTTAELIVSGQPVDLASFSKRVHGIA